jgi:hypothetical protein
MVNWEFSFSVYFVNVHYLSYLNDSYWKEPEIQEVDNCGPPNLISSGYALWLVLVPAVACVVQLPGSVFLYRRSNFYRFAPEIGVADCLATVILLAKALWKGYRWKESVAAVFLVREGIGRGDLWWRGIASVGTDNEAEDADAPAAVDSSDEPPVQESHENTRTKARLKPYDEPLSFERTIGAVLFVTALVKIITVFATASTNPAIRVTSIVALAYSFSFLIFEMLVWSLALVTSGYSLEDIPPESLLELLHFVDPGDNPFTFPSSSASPGGRTSNLIMELASMSAQTQSGTAAPPPSNASNIPTSPTTVPWNKAVAFSAASLGVLGPLMWIFILSNIWRPSKSVFFLSISALAFLSLRLVGQVATRIGHLSFAQQILIASPQWLWQLCEKASGLAKKLEQMFNTEPNLFLVLWLWERITTVNLFSTIWVTVICIYFARLFPQHSLESLGEPPAKPMWLGWLG